MYIFLSLSFLSVNIPLNLSAVFIHKLLTTISVCFQCTFFLSVFVNIHYYPPTCPELIHPTHGSSHQFDKHKVFIAGHWTVCLVDRDPAKLPLLTRIILIRSVVCCYLVISSAGAGCARWRPRGPPRYCACLTR